ncbi:MAG: hypothetical protein HYZ75_08845 [Elusimicrobia bacterium]|nr:hypothetical protein [Elusimicrobiota bacterium]
MRSLAIGALVALLSPAVRAAVAPLSPALRLDFDQPLEPRAGLRSASQEPAPALGKDEQGFFTYKVEAYPAQGVSCPEAAARLGAALAEAAGVTVSAAICEKAGAGGYDLAIEYRSAEKLNLVSTGKVNAGAYDRGGYASKAACEAARAPEAARFAKATGLAPVAVFCTQGKMPIEGSWTLVIDGFGKPELLPQVAGTYLFGQVQGFSESTFLAAVRAGLEREGLDVSFVRVKPSIGYSELSTLYYAKSRVRLQGTELAKLNTAAQCAEQLAAARTALSGSREPVVSFCQRTAVGMPYEVALINAGTPAPKASAGYETHASYAACMAGRGRMEDYYRGLGKTVLGSVCSWSESAWRVVVLQP